MKTIKLFSKIILASAILFTSCSKERTNDNNRQNNKAVEFTSAITYASGNSWADGDQLGMFMIKNGTDKTVAANYIYSNNKYTSNAAGIFTPSSAESTMYYPIDDTNVDFIAYYPFTAAASDYVYPVNVSSQTNHPAIDLLYTHNPANVNQNTTSPVRLTFNHMLSKIELTLKAGTGVSPEEFADAIVMLKGTNTTADFNLMTGTLTYTGSTSDITIPNIVAGSGAATVVKNSAIILPTLGTPGTRKISITTPAYGTYTTDIPASLVFESKKQLNITVKCNRTEIMIESAEIVDWDVVDHSGELIAE